MYRCPPMLNCPRGLVLVRPVWVIAPVQGQQAVGSGEVATFVQKRSCISANIKGSVARVLIGCQLAPVRTIPTDLP